MRRSLFLSGLMAVSVTLVLRAGPVHAQTISMSTVPQIGAGLQTSQLLATLSTSQHGGVTVHVESGDTAIARVSQTAGAVGAAAVDVFVPNGSTNATFYVHALEDTTGSATITASAPGFSGASRTATVVTPALDITGLAASIDTADPADVFQVRIGVPNAGGTAVAVVQDVRAGGGVTATVSNLNAAAGQLVTTPLTGQSVTVPIAAGQNNSPGSVAAGGVAFDGLSAGTTSVFATIPGFTSTTGATRAVTVTQPTIGLPSLPDVGSGLMSGAAIISLSASQHGGVTVRVQSSDSLVLLVSPGSGTPGAGAFEVFVPNGSTTTTMVLHGLEGIVSGFANVEVTATGFTGAVQSVHVVQPALDVIGLVSSIDTLDPPDNFQVRVGLPNASASLISLAQSVRAGSAGVTATVVCSDSLVGQCVTTAVTGDTVVVTIPAGSSGSATSVAGGGAAFDGTAAGSATISASIPGFVATTAASRVVTVTQPGISINTIPTVGAGLMVGTVGSLSAAQHGGVTVRFESADTTLALVSPNNATPGAPFFEVMVPNGSTSLTLVVHGREGASGTTDVLVTAPGFAGTSRSVSIVTPAFEITGLAGAMDTIDPDDPFQVRVGVANAGNTLLSQVQSVRAGSAGVVATLVSNPGGVGRLVTTAGSGDTVTVTIPAGAFNSPATVAGGGVAFDPLSGGVTTVSASLPNFAGTEAGARQVTVTEPSVVLPLLGDVGAGLMGSIETLTLSAANHGGVIVHIESGDSAVVRLAPDTSTPGHGALDVMVPNGVTSVPFVVHGMENAAGTVLITASAPGFVPAGGPVTIRQPALELSGLAASMDVDDADDPFLVRVGLPGTNNVSVTALQPARVGGPGVTATLVSSSPAVGRLVTAALTHDTVTVTIAPGQSASSSSVAAGGVAFTGLAIGTTLVSGRSPGFFATGAATQEVAVTDQLIALPVIEPVGAGLQSGAVIATLGFAAHGGVLVHVESGDPGIALVSPAFATAGTASFDVFVPDGSVTLTLFVHGSEDTSGTATITVSAPGFTPGQRLVQVVRPGVQIEQLAAAMTLYAPNDSFLVRVGVPDAGFATLQSVQAVRAGAAGMPVTLTSSDPGVAQLVTSGGSGSPVVVTLPAGATQSAVGAASGGVEFDPLTGGTTVVSAAIPGGVGVLASADTVIVTVPQAGADVAPPTGPELDPNRPNPFRGGTRIRFGVPRAMRVNVSVFDVHGRRVATLVDGWAPPGYTVLEWNGRGAGGAAARAGIYLCRMVADGRTLTRRMVRLR